MKNTILIIPDCTDQNRGDQALVLETKRIIEQVYGKSDIYMMSSGNVNQCMSYGLRPFKDILKHPSRYDKKNNNNVKYGSLLKIKWGTIAIKDIIYSKLILNRITRTLIVPFMDNDTKESLELFKKSKAIFVKGGGFLHDYSGGLTGLYTMYYQTYHIRLALKLKKKVYIMPNSYGPFKGTLSKRLVNKVLDQCAIVTARESISGDKKQNGLDRMMPVYPDLAFFLGNGNSNHIKGKLPKSGENIKGTVAITVRPYRFYNSQSPKEKYNKYKRSFIEFINYLTNENYRVLLVVHTISKTEHENDEKCIDELMEELKNNKKVIKIKNDNYDCYSLKEIYGQCDYVIGTRFHSVIFSLEQLIPCIAITYGGNKGTGIMKDIGMSEYAVDIEEVNSSRLINAFITLEANRKENIKKIQSYLTKSEKKYNLLISEIKKA